MEHAPKKRVRGLRLLSSHLGAGLNHERVQVAALLDIARQEQQQVQSELAPALFGGQEKQRFAQQLERLLRVATQGRNPHLGERPRQIRSREPERGERRLGEKRISLALIRRRIVAEPLELAVVRLQLLRGGLDLLPVSQVSQEGLVLLAQAPQLRVALEQAGALRHFDRLRELLHRPGGLTPIRHRLAPIRERLRGFVRP